MIQRYELMFVVPGTVDETAVPEIKNKVFGFLNDAKATITSQYDMGRRRLAYRIKQQSYGYYHVLQFDAEAEEILPLDKKIRLDSDIMRYILIKATPLTDQELKDMVEIPEEDKSYHQEVKPEAVLDDMQDVSAALPAASTSATTSTPLAAPAPTVPVATSQPATEKPEEVIVEKKEVEKEAPATQLSMEDLDKKLDEILDDSDITSKL